MARCATKKPAQHVAAALVARQDPVRQQEADRPEVVGHDPHGHVRLRIAAVLAPRRPGHRGQNRAEQVRVVVRVDALEHGGNPFEPRAGVDRRVRQRLATAVLVALELHEDEVPDLEIAARVRSFVEADFGQFRRGIDEDLAARAAGPGVAHGPEVVLLATAQNPLRRQPGQPHPEVRRLVVLPEHRGEEVLGRQAPDTRHELPGRRDRLFLEVVAEGEVTQHLEERVVPGTGPDVLQVVVLAGHPETLLRGHRARRVRLLDAEEVVLELDHPGIDEQQGRIVPRHEGRTRHLRVSAAGVEVDEAAPDVPTQHELWPWIRCFFLPLPAEALCATASSAASNRTAPIVRGRKPRRSRCRARAAVSREG